MVITHALSVPDIEVELSESINQLSSDQYKARCVMERLGRALISLALGVNWVQSANQLYLTCLYCAFRLETLNLFSFLLLQLNEFPGSHGIHFLYLMANISDSITFISAPRQCVVLLFQKASYFSSLALRSAHCDQLNLTTQRRRKSTPHSCASHTEALNELQKWNVNSWRVAACVQDCESFLSHFNRRTILYLQILRHIYKHLNKATMAAPSLANATPFVMFLLIELPPGTPSFILVTYPRCMDALLSSMYISMHSTGHLFKHRLA